MNHPLESTPLACTGPSAACSAPGAFPAEGKLGPGGECGPLLPRGGNGQAEARGWESRRTGPPPQAACELSTQTASIFSGGPRHSAGSEQQSLSHQLPTLASQGPCEGIVLLNKSHNIHLKVYREEEASVGGQLPPSRK